MAVLPQLQGQHLGEALLLATHAAVAAPMWCNARQAVVGFYERRGWLPVGEVFDIPGIGLHRRMIWPGPPAAD
jgi:predicted GNAT family N-acyltransferase